MNGDRKPKVLFPYYSFTQQTKLVVDAMADAMAARGCDVTKATISFIDPRHGKKFSTLPMRFPVLKIVSMLPAQLRRKTGEISIPPEAQAGEYDLVVLGSPTWWLTTNMPVRSYLKSPAGEAVLAGKPFAAASVSRRYWKGNIKGIRSLGEKAGGTWVAETHFVAAGGEVKSMIAWLAFMFFGASRERIFGIELPPPNLQPGYEEQARRFIDNVADRVFPAAN